MPSGKRHRASEAAGVGVFRRYGVEIAASVATACLVVAALLLLPLPRLAAKASPAEQALADRTQYSLDTVSFGRSSVKLRWHPQPLVAPARGDAIVFGGWAVDDPERAPIASVDAVVDGDATYRAVLGAPRADVAAKLGNPVFAGAGFALMIPACALAPGAHRVAFRFGAADGRGYYRSLDDVDVDVNAGPPNGRISYAVDSIVPNLSHAGPHEMRGWIVDAAACAPASGATVFVDGKAVSRAHTGGLRPDVATALGVPAYASAGFSAVWSDASLPRGAHTLRLWATTSAKDDVDSGFALHFTR